MDKKYDLHIVGAGLSGTLLAVLLAQKFNIKIALFESRKDLRKNDLSAGRSINLALAQRGIEALEAANLMDKIKPYLTPMYGRYLHNIDNTSNNLIGYSKDLKQSIYSLSRPKLNEILLDAAEQTNLVDIYFEHECTKLEINNNIIEFNNKINLNYNICVGADGFKSKVRQYSIEKNNTSNISIEPLGHSYKELTMPYVINKKTGNIDYQMPANALHIWPRGEYMLIALPNSDKSFTVTLFLPDNDIYNLNNEDKIQDFFSSTFPDALQLIPDLTNQFLHNPIGKLATIRCTTWHSNNTILIGDAAHAVVPFQGQGMNCAFEDVLCFANLYEKYFYNSTYNTNKFNKFALEFEYLRKDNANAIADMALDNYIEMRDTVISEKFKLKKQLAWYLEEKYPNKFIPKYSMIMFGNMPYKQVQDLAIKQEEILNILVENKNNLEQIDFDLADKLINEYIEYNNRIYANSTVVPRLDRGNQSGSRGQATG